MFGFFGLLRKRNESIRLYTETENGTKLLGEIIVTRPTRMAILMDSSILVLRQEIDNELVGSIGFSDYQARVKELGTPQRAVKRSTNWSAGFWENILSRTVPKSGMDSTSTGSFSSDTDGQRTPSRDAVCAD